MELLSIAATSVVSHNGCKSCWRWLTRKGTEATGVAKRGCHENGLAVVTRFGFASPLLFVLFVVCWKIPLVEILAQVATRVSSSSAGFLEFPDVRWPSYWECRLLLVSQHWSVREVQFQLICATSPSIRGFSIESGHGKSRAKSVTAQVFLVALSWLRPVPTWKHFQCPSSGPHSRRIHVVGFVTLEPSVLVGSLAAIADFEPLIRCAHVLPKHAFRTVVLVTLQLSDTELWPTPDVFSMRSCTQCLKYESAPCPSEDRAWYSPHGYLGLMSGSLACSRAVVPLRSTPFFLSTCSCVPQRSRSSSCGRDGGRARTL